MLKNAFAKVNYWIEYKAGPACEFAMLICMLPILIPLTWLIDKFDDK